MRYGLLMGMTVAAVLGSLPATGEAADARPALAFTFSHADTKTHGDGLPYFRAFPNGKDTKGQDASGSLGTLKFARGDSKLYPKEDAKPGLIVVLRRIVLVPREDGDYRAILEGEFNAVEAVLDKATMAKLQAGERTDLTFVSDSTKGVRPVGFNIQAKTRFRAALVEGDLHFFGGQGDSTITHYALTGNYKYVSAPIAFGPDDNKSPIYIGRASKPKLKSDGLPETLPIINLPD